MDLINFARKYDSLYEVYQFLDDISDYYTENSTFAGYYNQDTLAEFSDKNEKFILHAFGQSTSASSIEVELSYMTNGRGRFDQDIEVINMELTLNSLKLLLSTIQMVFSLDENVSNQRM